MTSLKNKEPRVETRATIQLNTINAYAVTFAIHATFYVIYKLFRI